jgi:glycosyltransferase involved in cell wall biosynthesis
MFSLHYGDGYAVPEIPPSVQTTFVPCAGGWSRRLQWTSKFKTRLIYRCAEARPDILHDTGLWLLTNHAAAQVSAQLKLPRVVSPRGMLSDWSLRHKNWKKKLAWLLYQRRDLEEAKVLHATSPAEAAEFRALGLGQPVAVIPNGVELPPPAPPAARGERRTVLFLSRLHPKKGLAEMVQAWAKVKPAGWRAVVAGAGEPGFVAGIQELVRSLGLQNDFEFKGAVSNENKWEYYRQADVFILPSHSENFGIVVAEALACGVPVIATRQTPWEELATHRCGWWCQGGADGLADALREALQTPSTALQEMGARGRQLVESKYAWAGVAARMLEVYRWMLAEQGKPECVLER